MEEVHVGVIYNTVLDSMSVFSTVTEAVMTYSYHAYVGHYEK